MGEHLEKGKKRREKTKETVESFECEIYLNRFFFFLSLPPWLVGWLFSLFMHKTDGQYASLLSLHIIIIIIENFIVIASEQIQNDDVLFENSKRTRGNRH